MEKVETVIEIEHFILCPHCGNSKHAVDHLFSDDKEKTFGRWFCNECGGGFTGKVKGMDVFVEKDKNRKDKCIVFMRNGNILLVIEGMYFDGEFDIDHQKYYYEEHTCPTNYLLDVLYVINLEDGDLDPHGIFKFVSAIALKDIELNDEEIIKIIPKEALSKSIFDSHSLPIEEIMRQRKKHLSGQIKGKNIEIKRPKEEINKQLDAESQFLNWIKVFYR